MAKKIVKKKAKIAVASASVAAASDQVEDGPKNPFDAMDDKKQSTSFELAAIRSLCRVSLHRAYRKRHCVEDVLKRRRFDTWSPWRGMIKKCFVLRIIPRDPECLTFCKERIKFPYTRF